MTSRLNHLHGEPPADVLGQKMESEQRKYSFQNKKKNHSLLAYFSLVSRQDGVVKGETGDNKLSKIYYCNIYASKQSDVDPVR